MKTLLAEYGFNHPWVLWLLPLALLPLLLERTHSRHYSSISMLPHDTLSQWISWLLKAFSVIGLAAIILGLAAPHSNEREIQKTGIGAQITLVLDRSASMDDLFSGDGNSQVGETKSAAASRLITEFINARQNDMFGMISFSNSAMYVLPLSENKQAMLHAVQATTGNTLFQTNIGAGLTSGIGLFDKVPNSGSRVIILLSDGAGNISDPIREKIRDWLAKFDISLYWIVLKKPGGISIFDTKYNGKDDSEIPIEIKLFNFFKSLNTPFKAYEADNSRVLAQAIDDINQKERKPIQYMEKIPGVDYAHWCYALAALMVALLLALKLLEVKSWQTT